MRPALEMGSEGKVMLGETWMEGLRPSMYYVNVSIERCVIREELAFSNKFTGDQCVQRNQSEYRRHDDHPLNRWNCLRSIKKRNRAFNSGLEVIRFEVISLARHRRGEMENVSDVLKHFIECI